MSESKGIHGAWLILATVALGGLMLWGYLDAHQFFSHVKLARITSEAWDGKPKDCEEWNATTDVPLLECDSGHSDVQETVRVRFYGDTHVDLQPETLRLHWKCTRTSESNAPVTCQIDSAN